MNPHKTRIVRCTKDSDGGERYGFTCTCFPEGRACYMANHQIAWERANDHETDPSMYATHDADIIPDESKYAEAHAVEWADCTHAEFMDALDTADPIIPTRSTHNVDGRLTYEVDAAWLAKYRELAKPWYGLAPGRYIVDDYEGEEGMYVVEVTDGHDVAFANGRPVPLLLRNE